MNLFLQFGEWGHHGTDETGTTHHLTSIAALPWGSLEKKHFRKLKEDIMET
jgi:hypothetical protein